MAVTGVQALTAFDNKTTQKIHQLELERRVRRKEGKEGLFLRPHSSLQIIGSEWICSAPVARGRLAILEDGEWLKPLHLTL